MPKILTVDGALQVDQFPLMCPHCRGQMNPQAVFWRRRDEYDVTVIYLCPLEYCGRLFFAYYERPDDFDVDRLTGTLPSLPVLEYEFDDLLQSRFPDFCTIFSQALQAHANGLDHVAGPGYRKALEFLVKESVSSHRCIAPVSAGGKGLCFSGFCAVF